MTGPEIFSGIGHITTVMDEPLPPRVRKILETAEANGWQLNPPGGTFVLRLTREDGQGEPFYMGWQIKARENGKYSWSFRAAYASNGQGMNYRDVMAYLADPSVIYPEPPEGLW